MERRRKEIRLKGWDYSNAAWYFVTVCCKDRKKLFGEVVDANGARLAAAVDDPTFRISDCRVELSPLGKLCRDTLTGLQDPSRAMHVVDFVVMPNHVHFTVAARRGGNASKSLPDFVRFMKSAVTRAARKSHPGIELWQSRYYDHVIRDDADYERIAEYIATNPARWANDRYFA